MMSVFETITSRGDDEGSIDSAETGFDDDGTFKSPQDIEDEEDHSSRGGSNVRGIFSCEF